MRKFLTYLEPRYFNEGDTIQEQNEEVYEVTFIMKGKAGVGYRLFNQIFYGMALQPRHVINDYAMLRNRVSEFFYKPILDKVEGLAINKNDWTRLFKIPFFNNNYFKSWCLKYV